MRNGEAFFIVGSYPIVQFKDRKKIMNNKNQIAFLIILIAVAVATLFFVILPPILYGTDQETNTSAPEQVVQEFYDWYVSYQGNPLVDKAYQTNELLSPAYLAHLDDFTQGGEWRVDPVLCAQDVPNEVTALPAVVAGNGATVEVNTSFTGHMFTVELANIDGNWLIDKVTCASE